MNGTTAIRAGSLRNLTLDAVSKMRTRPVVRHPAVAEIGVECIAWAREYRLVAGDLAAARLATIHCGDFAACCYPRASAEVVRLAADLVTWLFLFDDRYCERFDADPEELRALFGTFERYVRGAEPPDGTPFYPALGDIRRRALELGADATWVERFAADLAGYFEGCAQELPFRLRRAHPGVAEYRAIRFGSIGARPTFGLIELAGSYLLHRAPEVTDDTRSPILARAIEAASLAFGWKNDVYSYAKESSAGDPLNLVSVLKHQYRLSDAEAFAAAVEVFNTELSVLEETSAELRARGVSPELEHYLTCLDDWVHGSLAWAAACPRYQ